MHYENLQLKTVSDHKDGSYSSVLCMNYSAVTNDKPLDPRIRLSPLLDLCIVSVLRHYMELYMVFVFFTQGKKET